MAYIFPNVFTQPRAQLQHVYRTAAELCPECVTRYTPGVCKRFFRWRVWAGCRCVCWLNYTNDRTYIKRDVLAVRTSRESFSPAYIQMFAFTQVIQPMAHLSMSSIASRVPPGRVMKCAKRKGDNNIENKAKINENNEIR